MRGGMADRWGAAVWGRDIMDTGLDDGIEGALAEAREAALFIAGAGRGSADDFNELFNGCCGASGC